MEQIIGMQKPTGSSKKKNIIFSLFIDARNHNHWKTTAQSWSTMEICWKFLLCLGCPVFNWLRPFHTQNLTRHSTYTIRTVNSKHLAFGIFNSSFTSLGRNQVYSWHRYWNRDLIWQSLFNPEISSQKLKIIKLRHISA